MDPLISFSSPNQWGSYLLNDHFDMTDLDKDFGFMSSDLFQVELTGSLHNDIKKIESSGSLSASDLSDTTSNHEFEYPNQIKNSDCMWSGLGNSISSSVTTSSSSASSSSASSSSSSSSSTNSTSNYYSNSSYTKNYHISSNRYNNMKPQQQQKQQNDIGTEQNTNKNNNQHHKLITKSMQNIPAGQSLLINSRLNHTMKKSNQSSPATFYLSSAAPSFNAPTSARLQIPNLLTSEFLKDRESILNTRPDTPISLDDEAPEFKHTVDLAACITGSNNINLDLLNDTIQTGGIIGINGNNNNNNNNMCGIGGGISTADNMIINKLKEQLEDNSTKIMDMRQILPQHTKNRSLSEVLNAIGSIENEYNHHHRNHNANLNISDSDDYDDDDDDEEEGDEEEEEDDDDDDDEEEEEDSISNTSSISSNVSSAGASTINSSIIGDTLLLTSAGTTTAASTIPIGNIIGNNSPTGSNSSSANSSVFSSPLRQNNYTYPVLMHSDHSYTRSKDGHHGVVDVSGIGLETPSDSDEEIDVVSVGDKKLPTNPSDKDRRALQTKVAHKISARIVKQPNGIRTIPPRRRISYEPYPIPSLPTPTKSVANSRYPSPASTPYSSYASSVISTGSIKYQTANHNNGNSSSSRKRNQAAAALAATPSITIKEEYLPPSKRHRGKKALQQQQQQLLLQQQQQQQLQKNHHQTSAAALSVNQHHHHHHHHHTKKQNVNEVIDESDTIEKRNLHNDMERQRRIGLKNLFEALKKQIPTIKDKERAPKVSILREAAKLCEQLHREDKLISSQKQQLLNQIQRRESQLINLKASLCKKEYD